MIYIKYAFVISLVFTFVSCRKLVQEEFPNFPVSPVVNSILISDSTIKVHVSLTDKIDTNRLGYVDSAEVFLYIDGEFKEQLTYTSDGIYSSNTIIVPGKTYSCMVSVPGFPLVSCTDSIPEPTKITNIIHTNNAGIDQDGLTYPSIQFTLENNPSKKEYFEIIIKLIEYDELVDASIIYIADPVLLNEGLPIAVFSDELMGNYYTMTLNYTTGSSGSKNNEPIHTNLFPLYIEVRSISYDYYMYRKQLCLYETSRYPDIIAGVVTSFSLYSNIESGYGIFAGYSPLVSDTLNPNSLYK